MTLLLRSRKVVFYAICILCIVAGAQTVSAQQEFYPFLGKITENDVNVRAGQSENYERLCQLNKDDDVIVLGKKYSWYKIKLPGFADSYISANLVKLLSGIKAEVTGDKVNVRARDSINSTVMGKVVKGDMVFIVGLVGTWYKIEPVDNSYGWISEDFIRFASKDISAYKTDYVSIEEQERLRVAKEKEEEQKRQAELKAQKERERRAKMKTVQGVLGIDEKRGITDIRYVILKDGKPVYYLDGFNHLLDKFMNYTVKVEGELNTEVSGKYSLPVLKISKIQLVI